MDYGDFKDLNREQLLIKYCVIRYLRLLKTQNMMHIIGGLFTMFLINKTSVGTIKNKRISNKKLAEELNKPIIRKFNKRKYINLLWTTFGVQIKHICN